MRITIETIKRIAPRRSNVLLIGESGSGKGLCAKLLHRYSPRCDKPFIKAVCGALPETLIDNDLFGHERGAFTGADTAKPGKFELAEDGTIFLDEIGDLALSAQMKLLRVLDDREFERLGGIKTLHCNARVIAATHRDLKMLIREGTFRADLYYRLSVITVQVPPLRERREDIPALVRAFLAELTEGPSSPPSAMTPQVMSILQGYGWPGNVRELRNVIERMLALDLDGVLHVDDLPPDLLELASNGAYRSRAIAAVPEERDRILMALGQNPTVKQAAAELEVSPSYFYRLMRKHGISPRKS